MRILTMDGGGNQSLFTLALLRRIEAARPGFLASIDMFAGTSSGGINAILMAATEPKEVPRREALADARYLWESGNVFETTYVKMLQGLGGCRAMISNDNLKQFLTQKLGERTLGDLNAKIAITAFDNTDRINKRSWSPKVFHNFPRNHETEPDLALQAVEVALSTSAAPVFFPIHNGYSDGGLFANNPAACALAQAHSTKGGQVPLEDIKLLSVGTGGSERHLDVTNDSWGYSQWLLNPCDPLTLIEAVFRGTTMAADYQCRAMLEDRFFRLNPLVPKNLDLDFEDEFKDASTPGVKQQLQVLMEKVDNTPVEGPGDPVDLNDALGTNNIERKDWLAAVLAWLDRNEWHTPAETESTSGQTPKKTTKRRTTRTKKPRE